MNIKIILFFHSKDYTLPRINSRKSVKWSAVPSASLVTLISIVLEKTKKISGEIEKEREREGGKGI